MREELSPQTLSRLSSFIGSTIGLHFPPERWRELAHGMVTLGALRGFADAEDCAAWLLSSSLSREQIEMAARQLTVGETYFFRERAGLDAVEREVLPDLIRRRRASGVRLRIWSAGCCTGEEPYSVAMMLDMMLPDLSDWNITILATDINSRFLEIASAAEYGAWSFRSVPPGIKERYFTATAAGRFQLARKIRRMVTFSALNLAEDVYPSLAGATNAMDIVLCRNVLMYFAPEQAARVASNIRAALVDGGWLLVAPCETSQTLFKGFATVNFPEAILYRKSPLPPAQPVTWAAPTPGQIRSAEPGLSLPSEEPLPGAEPVAPAREPATDGPIIDAQTLANRESSGQPASQDELARVLANQGELSQALALCDQAIAADGVDPAKRFLRALVAQELGMLDEARESLERTLYLDPDFVMAHVALGSLARRLGRPRQSRRHLQTALSLLTRLAPDAPVAEASGLTAGRLIETIRATVDWRDEA